MTEAPDGPRATHRFPIRWLIAGMLLLLSVLNYIDRQALAILATRIQAELGLTDWHYGKVTQAFLLCYTLVYFFAGRLVDRFGPRLAETAFVTWWSIANMLTALATGFFSLMGMRCLLGLGEPGHFAVAAKSVGQWFPPREKGIAAGMYVMGGTLGAAIAAPLVAWLTLRWGWRAAFVVTGAMGLVLAAAWWWIYRAPTQHPWVGEKEANTLREHGLLDPGAASTPPPPLRELLRWKSLWLITGVRMLTDSVWYFYLVWFAKYLQEFRGYDLKNIGYLGFVFIAADIGCLAAGAFSGWFIRRGVIAPLARLRVMVGAAVVLAFSFTLPLVPGAFWPVVLASIFAGCVMLFMASAVTLPLDLFPRYALGSAQGIIGMGGSIGGFLATGLIAWVLTEHKSYDAVFTGMSFLHPLAAVALVVLLPRLTKASSPA